MWLRWDYRILERYKYLFGISAVALLLLPSVPGLGQRINGVRLWVEVGPLQFQPGELAKIFMIVFLAAYLRDKRESLAQGRLKDVGPLLAIWGASMLVLVQTSDLGAALLSFGIFLAMLYAATGRALYVGAGLALFAAGSAALYNALPRVEQRVTVWLHPWTDEKVPCSTGGARLPPVLRLVPAREEPLLDRERRLRRHRARSGDVRDARRHAADPRAQHRLHLLRDRPGARADRRGGDPAPLPRVRRARHAHRARRARTASRSCSRSGLTFGFALQTFIIVGGVLRLVPLTGITLPFVSYGGSSILSNFVMLALLLLVSNRAVAAAQPR